MGETSKMRIEFEVGAAGVDEGIQVATSSIDSFLERIKDTGSKASDTDRKFEKLTDTLKNYKSEQVAQARTARYFAGELASIIPGAEGASGALQKLVAIGLEGFGIGLAIESTLFVLGQVADHLREQEKQAQALRQIHRDTWKGAADALDDFQHGLSKTGTQTDEVWRGVSKRVHDEVAKIEGEIDDYQHSFAAHARDGAKGLMALFGFDPEKNDGPIEGAQEKIEKMREKQKALLDTLKDPDLQEKKRLASTNEDHKKEADHEREREKLAAETDDEIVRIRLDRDQKLETMRRVDFGSDADFAKQREAIEADASEKIRRLRQDRDLKDAALRRTAAADNGTAVEKLDAEHENRVEELRAQVRRTSIAAEQQRIRQEIADETEKYLAKRGILQREIDERLRLGAVATDRKKYDEEIALLKTKSDVEDEIRARAEARGNEQLAQEFLRIQQSHDKARQDLEILHGEKLISEANYQQAVRELEDRTNAERLKAAGAASGANEFINPLVQNWQTGLQQMLSGTYNWSNLTRNVFGSLAGSFAQGVSQMAANWLGEHALMFAGWAALKVKEAVLHTTTEAAKTTATIAGVAARVPAEAGEAAVLAGGSAAAVPFIGWAIALPAAAAVLGGLIGYGLAHAAGGYDIGSENPITQLHAREMVLPASIAEPLRRNLADGGSGGGSTVLQLQLPDVLDATGLDRVLEKHSGSLLRALRALKQNNRFP